MGTTTRTVMDEIRAAMGTAINKMRESVTKVMEDSRYMIRSSITKEYQTVLEGALEWTRQSLINNVFSGIRGLLGGFQA